MICGIFAAFWHVDETNRGLVCTGSERPCPENSQLQARYLPVTVTDACQGKLLGKGKERKGRPTLESSKLSFPLHSVEFDLGAEEPGAHEPGQTGSVPGRHKTG